MDPSLLFGKYQILQILGNGRAGTVYLAVHRELEEFRAIKTVSKSDSRYPVFKREALILKSLNHPGIPKVYDLSEDEENSYIIEEFIQGINLEALIKLRGPLAHCTVLRYVIQICGEVQYLHSAGTEPILYLDLQPKNLLVCHENVMLVDFDQAASLSEANKAGMRYGTPGFAAPEQYDSSQTLDERTDIYAIGVLFFYLATGKTPQKGETLQTIREQLWSREAGRIVAVCMAAEKEGRFESVSQLKHACEALLKDSVSSLTIAVYGNEPRVGVTHICLALCCYLWEAGIPNLYEACRPGRAVSVLQEEAEAELDEYGIFTAHRCRIKPCFGKQVHVKAHGYPLVIQDWGSLSPCEGAVQSRQSERLTGDKEPELALLVAGGGLWSMPVQIGERPFPVERDRILVLYQCVASTAKRKRPEQLRRNQLLTVPYFPDPFSPDREGKQWLEELYSRIRRITGTGQAIKKVTVHTWYPARRFCEFYLQKSQSEQ